MRAVVPRHIVPIHDKVVAEHTRGIYLNHVRDFRRGGVDVVDITQSVTTRLT